MKEAEEDEKSALSSQTLDEIASHLKQSLNNVMLRFV